MTQGEQPYEIESVPMREVAEALRHTRPFAEATIAAISGVDVVNRVRVKAGSVLVEPGQPLNFYWLVLEGEMRAERPEPDGSRTVVGMASAGDGFGEAPLLTGKGHSPFFILAALHRAGLLDHASLLPCCAESSAGQHGAAAAGVPSGGPAPREASFSGYACRRIDA